MSGVLSGAVVPHAPLLLPDVVGDKLAQQTELVRRAIGTLSFPNAEVIVVLSPHAGSSGVYASIEGSLHDFSVAEVDVSRSSDSCAVGALAELWGKPVLKEHVDHGVLVPLKLLPGSATVVTAGIREIEASRAEGSGSNTGDNARGAIADGMSFGRALLRLAENASVAFVVSAHTCSALSPRAPLTERVEAKPVEAAVLSALRGDPVGLRALLVDLWARGGSCSVGSLAAYGHVFGGRSSKILAYAHPFGVGYVVAHVN